MYFSDLLNVIVFNVIILGFETLCSTTKMFLHLCFLHGLYRIRSQRNHVEFGILPTKNNILKSLSTRLCYILRTILR
jgi:hypothetical protein